MSIRHASRSVVDGLSLSRSSNYICRQCRRNAHPAQIAIQQRQFASDRTEDLPFAERVRRKLWKGKPPGPENVDDLYGGPGALETMYKNRKERRARGHPSTPSTHVPPDAPRETQASTRAHTEDHIQISEQEPEERKLAPVKQSMASQSKAVIAEEDSEETARDGTGYKPATSWEGLPVIGSTGHWRERPVRAIDEYLHWLESPIRPEWSYAELVSLMHQAITEALTYEQTSGGAAQVLKITAEGPIPVSELEKATFRVSKEFSITAVQNITPIRDLSPEDVYFRTTPTLDTSVKYSFQEEEAIKARTEPVMTPLQPRLLYDPEDMAFLDATLHLENKLTMTILKRFSYLANHTIPDPILSELASPDPARNTIRTFLTSMTEKIKSKPAKVAEQLLQNEALAMQSNLLILGRRETPVDKEKELGRWKVIEQELRERGLPVLGKLAVQR